MARSGGDVHGDYSRKQQMLSHFGGQLEALRCVRAITDDARNVWFHKMLVALGYEPPDPAPPGAAQVICVGDPKLRPEPPLELPSPQFLRSARGPDEQIEVHGIRFRVGAVEIYDAAGDIRWRVSPEPDPCSFCPDERAALEADMAGVDD